MSKIIKEQINQLKPSATLAINEESNKLKKSGRKFINLVLVNLHFQYQNLLFQH